MAERTITVDETVRSRLGPELMARLARHLWPIDCQKCGRGFGRLRKPVLGVRDYGDLASARLYHRRCLAEPWLRTSEVQLTGRRTLTWRTSVLQRTPDVLLFMVNPSCEAAILLPDGTGWRLGTIDYYEKCGLSVDTDPEETPALAARLLPAGHLVAELDPIPGLPSHTWQWTMPPGHPMTIQLQSLTTVLVGVTTALRAGDGRTTEDELGAAMHNREIAFGLATLTRT